MLASSATGFPALSVEYGGGAFFIPYLLALFLIGVPILILEIGFGKFGPAQRETETKQSHQPTTDKPFVCSVLCPGQFFQTGDVNVFGGFHPRFRGVGVASVCCGFMLVVYYSILIAWVLNAFFDSFGSDDPWDREGVNGTVAIDYFVGEIIGAKTLSEDGSPTRMVWANVGYSALVWGISFFGTAFGVEWTGRITYVTMVC